MPSRKARASPPNRSTRTSFRVGAGDRFTDEKGEWEVTSRPVAFKQGHEVRARVQRVSDPRSVKDAVWPAHEKLIIRREEKNERSSSRRGRLHVGQETTREVVLVRRWLVWVPKTLAGDFRILPVPVMVAPRRV